MVGSGIVAKAGSTSAGIKRQTQMNVQCYDSE
jgi:hypothetical protein